MLNTTRRLAPVEPDWEGLLRNLRREGTPERVYYFEHGIADNILAELDAIHGISAGLAAAEQGHAAARRAAIAWARGTG